MHTTGPSFTGTTGKPILELFRRPFPCTKLKKKMSLIIKQARYMVPIGILLLVYLPRALKGVALPPTVQESLGCQGQGRHTSPGKRWPR